VSAILKDIAVHFLILDPQAFQLDGARPLFKGARGGRFLSLYRCPVRRDLHEEYYTLDPAFIRFSSGTTGASKGVLLSHQTIVERIAAANRVLALTEGDRVIWVLPMSYHFVVSILLFLRQGATIILCCRDLLSSLVEGLARHRATFIYASPFHYQMMTNSREISREMLSSIRLAVSTAIELAEPDARRFREKFGFELAQAYGIIEVGLPFVNTSQDPARRRPVGRVLPDYDVQIVNPDSEGIGEIQIKGKGLFDAYASPWQSRDQVLVDGWFKSGDLGRIDRDGFLFLCGREKNLINFAGMKIFPEEVESVVNQHPAVKESLVYAKPHTRYGELPCAQVVLRNGAEAEDFDSQEIRRFCYRYLAPYKVPKEFRCAARLDKTDSGKLRRRKGVPRTLDKG
jgi:long-chain acyl-CoA synthetase